MEQGTLATVIIAALAAISTVNGAVIAAMKIMWNKLTECEKGHSECREKSASLEAKAAVLQATNEYQANQIENLQSNAAEAKAKAVRAETDASAAHAKIREIEEKVGISDSQSRSTP